MFGDSSSVCGMKFEDAKLELEEVPDLKGGKAVLVAHLKGFLAEASIPIKLTKNEFHNTIEGYPPLYRESFQMRPSAPHMPYPIKELRDFQVHDAWIIAVGLAKGIHAAMPIFFDPLPPGAPDEMDPCSGFGNSNNSLTRVIQTLKLIQTAFATACAKDKRTIDLVIRIITALHDTRIESNFYSFLVGSDLHNAVPIEMSAQQCEFILGLFKTNVTESSVLSRTDNMQLNPILFQVLYVALRGTGEVVNYYKNSYNQVRIPDLLKKHDVVYLRGCVGD